MLYKNSFADLQVGLPWGGWEVRLRSSKFSFAEEKKTFFLASQPLETWNAWWCGTKKIFGTVERERERDLFFSSFRLISSFCSRFFEGYFFCISCGQLCFENLRICVEGRRTPFPRSFQRRNAFFWRYSKEFRIMTRIYNNGCPHQFQVLPYFWERRF